MKLSKLVGHAALTSGVCRVAASPIPSAKESLSLPFHELHTVVDGLQSEHLGASLQVNDEVVARGSKPADGKVTIVLPGVGTLELGKVVDGKLLPDESHELEKRATSTNLSAAAANANNVEDHKTRNILLGVGLGLGALSLPLPLLKLYFKCTDGRARRRREAVRNQPHVIGLDQSRLRSGTTADGFEMSSRMEAQQTRTGPTVPERAYRALTEGLFQSNGPQGNDGFDSP